MTYDELHANALRTALVMLRRRAGISQTAIADTIGISQSTISRYEIGNAVRIMPLSALQAYARAVGARLVVTVEDDEPPRRRRPFNDE